jgi:aspartate/methionine/tyrosine aminotransferase
VRALCQVAAEHDLVIISDEIYRDLTYETVAPVPSPALIAPARTVVTTALSKNLAVGGWRIGVARLPAGPAGDGLRDRLVGIGSEIWSAPSAPGQTPPDRYGDAAGHAFGEEEQALRLRLATGLLYGDSEAQQEAALIASDPVTLPWISSTVDRIEEILADLALRARQRHVA